MDIAITRRDISNAYTLNTILNLHQQFHTNDQDHTLKDSFSIDVVIYIFIKFLYIH